MDNLIKERYKITKVLSKSSHCRTFLAQDCKRPGAPKCVVKHLSNSAAKQSKKYYCLQNLFAKKVAVLTKLNRVERVPKLLDCFEARTGFFFVQEYISGHSLEKELQPAKKWNEAQVIALLQEVLTILEFIHNLGLIHGNIKPSNVFRQAEDRRLVLSGFGCIGLVWQQAATSLVERTPSALAVGTPGYMPTEQALGQPRPSSDIYALGVVAIQALTGKPPQQVWENAATGEMIWQHQVKSASPKLVQLLNKMVQPQPSERYSNATDALQALQHCILQSRKTETKLIKPTANKTVKISSFTIGIVMGLATGIALLLAHYHFLPLGNKSKVAAVLTTDVGSTTNIFTAERSHHYNLVDSAGSFFNLLIE